MFKVKLQELIIEIHYLAYRKVENYYNLKNYLKLVDLLLFF